MRSAYVLLAFMVALWLGAAHVIQQFKVSPPTQVERLLRAF